MIGLIWVALIAGIVWSYRRKKAQRDAERATQFDVLYTDLKLNRGAAAPAPVVDAPAAALPVTTAPAPESVGEYCRKPRLLGQPDALLYFLFRTGLPDHEILANVPLCDVVEVADSLRSFEREQKVRRLAQIRLDLVVCTRQLEVMAVVMISRDGLQDAAQAENTRFAGQCLRTAGIRLIRVDRTALPRHHQVRDMVYGSAGQANGPGT